MNEQLKKRLIGAAVLVALAAIFIPMLFNNGDETEIPTFGSNVPDKPETQFQTIEVPLQIPPPQSAETRPIETQKDAATAESLSAPPVEASHSTDTPILLPAPVAPAIASAEPVNEPSTETVAAPTPKAEPAPAKSTTSAASSSTKPANGWAVQLGSFGKSDNALALRNKLRKKGYAAFVEQQKGNSGTSYRVRVGPELKREKADALKAKLEKAGFKGVVMPHP